VSPQKKSTGVTISIIMILSVKVAYVVEMRDVNVFLVGRARYRWEGDIKFYL
jgi:hypothetical protein